MPSTRRLPKGFRYLFTLKEVKAIAAAAGAKFSTIKTGNVGASKHWQEDSFFQSSFSPFSINAYLTTEGWQFNIHQAGFRAELLPSEFEFTVKNELQDKFTAFLHCVRTAKETDFLNTPGIRAHVIIMNSKACISYTEQR